MPRREASLQRRAEISGSSARIGAVIGVSPTNPHLTFGFGRQKCLGLHLAKAEIEEALVVLSRRMSRVELDGPPVWQTISSRCRAMSRIAGCPRAFRSPTRRCPRDI